MVQGQIITRFLCLLLVIFIFLPHGIQSNILISQQITLVDQLTKDYLTAEQELWKIIERRDPDTLQQIYNLHMEFLKQPYNGTNILLNGKSISNNQMVRKSLMAINVTSRDIAQEFFEPIVRNYSVLSIKALNGVELEKIFEVVYNHTINSTQFWNIMKNSTEECHLLSRSVQSEQQVLYEYYKDIQAAALRTYITTQLSFIILHLHESGNFREQSIAYRERFMNTNQKIRDSFQAKLRTANRDVWNCDPINYSARDANFEITRFLQGFIESEANLNRERSCALTCGDFQNTRNYGCYDGSFCAEMKPDQRALLGCKGKIRGCQNIDDSLNVCPSESKNGSRYKYIKSDTGLKFGNITACSTQEIKANAWIRWFVKCSNCFCLCDDPSESERHFSLLGAVSNIEKNRVVTGVQLLKRNGIIQFSIAERELSAYGNVDSVIDERLLWKLSPQFNLTDNSTKENVDYIALTYENRSLNLDTIVAPNDEVVTGVRFQRSNAGHLILEVRFTEIDVAAGKLINLERSFWLSNKNGGKHRISTDNFDLSINSPKLSQPNFQPNAYVRFGPTHKKADISQRTIPFIESLKVEANPPVPLSGVGLYYKGQHGYGGFIAPKIVLYNFGKATNDN